MNANSQSHADEEQNDNLIDKLKKNDRESQFNYLDHWNNKSSAGLGGSQWGDGVYGQRLESRAYYGNG